MEATRYQEILHFWTTIVGMQVAASRAPEDTACAALQFDSYERLEAMVSGIPGAVRQGKGYLVHDPAGNAILFTVADVADL